MGSAFALVLVFFCFGLAKNDAVVLSSFGLIRAGFGFAKLIEVNDICHLLRWFRGE